VVGVLWRLDAAHLATLDDQEGVPHGIYRRFRIRVRLLDGSDQHVDCITYQVTKEWLETEDETARPSKVYKRVMLKGAREHNLPEDYIKR